ncbi:MAG: hypothetical protein AAF688_14500 [Bacteroidota bacterium]
MNQSTCAVCGEILRGRTDKKYCSRKCRSVAQYENRLKTETFYLEVDKQLRTNRKILKKYNLSGYTTIRKSEILKLGFNPRFFTHYWKNTKGDVYLFVYEFGFLDLSKNGKDKYLLVKWQEYMA